MSRSVPCVIVLCILACLTSGVPIGLGYPVTLLLYLAWNPDPCNGGAFSERTYLGELE